MRFFKNHKIMSVLLIAVIAGGVLWLVFHKSGTGGAKTASQSSSQSAAKTDSSKQSGAAQAATVNSGTIRILGAGDFIAHDSINMHAKTADGSYNYMPMMDSFTSIFHAADIRFCNDANLNGGAAYGISGWPKFNSPTEFARDMGNVGCNMVNTGTNHTFDRNQAAINASIDAWDKVPNTLAVVGQNRNVAEHDAVHTFTVKGVKIAFLAYTTYLNTDAPAQNDYGVNLFSRDFAASQIKAAKDGGVQYIIVSIRWGTEFSGDVNASQKSDAQWLADQGVNLVLGHGSHVLQPVQQLTGVNGNKTTVWYSLGNFLNTQLPAETLFNGLAVIDVDAKTLQITKMSFLPIYQHYEWSAAQAAAQDLLTRNNIKMYFMDDATQAMINAQQLNTTVAAQKARLQSTLNTYMNSISLITKQQYLAQ